MNYLSQFAATEAKPDMFSSIGIDWKLLILQSIAFLILLWFLKKFVYPALVAMLDRREKLIEESTKAALEAEKNAAAAEAKTTKMIKQARVEADEMLAGAKAEASNIVDEAEKKSRKRAEQIVSDAEAEISRSIDVARKTLRNETIGLVTEATEKVVGKSVTATVDKKIVADAVKEAEA